MGKTPFSSNEIQEQNAPKRITKSNSDDLNKVNQVAQKEHQNQQ